MTASLITFGLVLAVAPTAAADPADPADPGSAPPAPGAPPPSAFASNSADPSPAAADACKQFSGAMNFAATNYEDFAYATAGTGNLVNYADPSVSDANVAGRTALRQAAGVALQASSTPGLQPEIAGPMQKWSVDAAKLIIIMGVRGGGDALNSAATDLNNDARAVQMACAAAGTRA